MNQILLIPREKWKMNKFYFIILEWNPEIQPKYGMVDFDIAEINSLEFVFPGIKVFLCDFHREQAWHRYLNASFKIN